MRWRALQKLKVYVKQRLNGRQLTVEDVQEMVKNDNHMAERVMRFGEGLRGTRQFWKKRSFKLSDMIKQLGAQGMIFFTFSAADLHWPDLHKLMPHGENPIDVGSDEDQSKHRRQDLINNPHIAAWFFDKRFQIFLKTVLISKWGLEDYWYRYEWQHQGSVHVHGTEIMRNAPLFDWDNMKNNNDEMSRILSHFDSLITTINPCPDAPVPDRHPCQKGNEELCDNLQDYIELVNKLQKHTRCNPLYCLRSKDGQQYCRFGFPKDNVEHSFIHENDRGQPELITSRNDPYVNSHNRLQL